MVSSVSPGGCHSGQVVLVVIMSYPSSLLHQSPLHERPRRSQVLEKTVALQRRASPTHAVMSGVGVVTLEQRVGLGYPPREISRPGSIEVCARSAQICRCQRKEKA